MKIERESYLSQIRPFINTPFIKVLTGIRRCGKSTILELLKDELIASGINEKAVVHINLELYSIEDILIPEKLVKEITERLEISPKIYLLLDEVQLLSGWERVINSFFAAKNADIFITGSNSTLLSSELATLLSGRYVQFTIRPLSFAEYLTFIRDIRNSSISDPTAHIWDYIKLGGFPTIHYFKEMNSALIYKAVSDIYSTVVLKDVMQRNGLRNTDMLERVVRFVFDNVGKLFSARSISGYFTSHGRKLSVDTILDYITALERAYIIEKVHRYDIKGKKLLNLQEKYFVSDVSFIHALLGYDDNRIAGIMENIVYNELRRKGWEVFTGQLNDKEIDFVCTKQNEKMYIQVTYIINNDLKIIEREFGNLLKIKDQFPKYVVSLDKNRTSSVEGVQHIYLPDFLLMENADYKS
ncbi:ATP-binding protein [Treponema primitia]|nr:ATP-binding protein [Treponema primitia]